jgi:hypothetical protein
MVAQRVQQRHARVEVERVRLPVDRQFGSHGEVLLADE